MRNTLSTCDSSRPERVARTSCPKPATSGIGLHHLGRVARRVEGERDEAHLAVQRGRIDDRLLERVENAVGERAAVGIAAGRVDEAEYRDLAARVARERRALAVEADDAPFRRGHDVV